MCFVRKEEWQNIRGILKILLICDRMYLAKREIVLINQLKENLNEGEIYEENTDN